MATYPMWELARAGPTASPSRSGRLVTVVVLAATTGDGERRRTFGRRWLGEDVGRGNWASQWETEKLGGVVGVRRSQFAEPLATSSTGCCASTTDTSSSDGSGHSPGNKSTEQRRRQRTEQIEYVIETASIRHMVGTGRRGGRQRRHNTWRRGDANVFLVFIRKRLVVPVRRCLALKVLGRTWRCLKDSFPFCKSISCHALLPQNCRWIRRRRRCQWRKSL